MEKFVFALTLLLLLGGLALTAPREVHAQGLFTDVSSSHTYFDAIEFLKSEGIVEGYSDGTYQPERTLNRVELLKIIIEAVYEEEFESFSNSSCFDDVAAGLWYSKYVCFAKNAGIVEGYGDGTFKPAQEINFVEATKIALETFGYDYLNLDPWYKGIVEEASENNFIPLDVTAFDQKFSRGQMADMITRILKSRTDELTDYLGENADQFLTYEGILKGTGTESTSETGTGTESEAKTYLIQIVDFEYVPEIFEIESGDTIEWTNQDSSAHTVTFRDGELEFDEEVKSGETISHTFTESGELDYYCVYHPNMEAELSVH